MSVAKFSPVSKSPVLFQPILSILSSEKFYLYSLFFWPVIRLWDHLFGKTWLECTVETRKSGQNQKEEEVIKLKRYLVSNKRNKRSAWFLIKPRLWCRSPRAVLDLLCKPEREPWAIPEEVTYNWPKPCKLNKLSFFNVCLPVLIGYWTSHVNIYIYAHKWHTAYFWPFALGCTKNQWLILLNSGFSYEWECDDHYVNVFKKSSVSHFTDI